MGASESSKQLSNVSHMLSHSRFEEHVVSKGKELVLASAPVRRIGGHSGDDGCRL